MMFQIRLKFGTSEKSASSHPHQTELFFDRAASETVCGGVRLSRSSTGTQRKRTNESKSKILFCSAKRDLRIKDRRFDALGMGLAGYEAKETDGEDPQFSNRSFGRGKFVFHFNNISHYAMRRNRQGFIFDGLVAESSHKKLCHDIFSHGEYIEVNLGWGISRHLGFEMS